LNEPSSVVPLARDFEKLRAKLDPSSSTSTTAKQHHHHHDNGKEDDSLFKPLVNQEVELRLRNGQSLTGVLRKATRFELLIETSPSQERLILMKHAVDLVVLKNSAEREKVERLIGEMPR